MFSDFGFPDRERCGMNEGGNEKQESCGSGARTAGGSKRWESAGEKIDARATGKERSKSGASTVVE